MYTVGIDFGTESVRAVIFDVETGQEMATAVHSYPAGVITDTLPGTDIKLETDWALQNPQDYLHVLKKAVPTVLAESGISPDEIIGVGIDFTSPTIIPTTAEGLPLCFLPEWKTEPHAWVKLWKHHAAQPEATKLNEIAAEQGYEFLQRYGGKANSEWFVPKIWQILDEAPEVYEAAERFVEAGDWIVWQLTGHHVLNSCAAGYKAMWSKREGFPAQEFYEALDPRLGNLISEKIATDVVAVGEKAGELNKAAAEWTGLNVRTPVTVSNIDAHASMPACLVVEPGTMGMIMGTSNCHMLLGTEERPIPGICGYVEDGIVPGYIGYEAGQSCAGDHFSWFVNNCLPESYQQEAAKANISVHDLLEQKAAVLKPGESGLIALDWWNGNRSVLVDGDLTGLLLGATLATKPEEIYRALIEATAYGTRMIIDTFTEYDLQIDRIVATGGLPERNKLLMQLYADITGREIMVATSTQGSALGSAMFAAVAAGSDHGGYDSILDASKRMVHLRDEVYTPRPEAQAVYDELYAEYVVLHGYFGRGENNVMKRLKRLKERVLLGEDIPLG